MANPLYDQMIAGFAGMAASYTPEGRLVQDFSAKQMKKLDRDNRKETAGEIGYYGNLIKQAVSDGEDPSVVEAYKKLQAIAIAEASGS